MNPATIATLAVCALLIYTIAILAAYASCDTHDGTFADTARDAVAQADALIQALNTTKP